MYTYTYIICYLYKYIYIYNRIYYYNNEILVGIIPKPYTIQGINTT